MNELLGLFGDGSYYFWVGMTGRIDCDPCGKVEIPLPIHIPYFNALPVIHHEWIPTGIRR